MEQLSSTQKAYIRSQVNYNAALAAIIEIYPDIWKANLLKQQLDIVAEFPIPQYANGRDSMRVITKRMDKMVEIIQSLASRDLNKFQESAAMKAEQLSQEAEQLIERHELVRKLKENLDKDFERFDKKINTFNI